MEATSGRVRLVRLLLSSFTDMSTQKTARERFRARSSGHSDVRSASFCCTAIDSHWKHQQFAVQSVCRVSYGSEFLIISEITKACSEITRAMVVNEGLHVFSLYGILCLIFRSWRGQKALA